MIKLAIYIVLAILAYSHFAEAAPQAKEIAFARPCPQGVPVYNKSSEKVGCGALAQGGSGYVIEMASDRATKPTCPKGFAYIGNLDQASLAGRGITAEGKLQYFACVKE